MSELEKRFIAEALAKKYAEEHGEGKSRDMTTGYLVDDEGKPIVQE